MRKVIDLECDLPPDEDGNPRKLESATHPPGYGDPEKLEPLDGHGFSNNMDLMNGILRHWTMRNVRREAYGL